LVGEMRDALARAKPGTVQRVGRPPETSDDIVKNSRRR
jgi:hypothetical protein